MWIVCVCVEAVYAGIKMSCIVAGRAGGCVMQIGVVFGVLRGLTGGNSWRNQREREKHTNARSFLENNMHAPKQSCSTHSPFSLLVLSSFVSILLRKKEKLLDGFNISFVSPIGNSTIIFRSAVCFFDFSPITLHVFPFWVSGEILTMSHTVFGYRLKQCSANAKTKWSKLC